jgi:putative ABC transport system permease protein
MVIRALDRKLLRDLARMRGQVVTIALVVACGVAAFVTFLGAYRALRVAQASYYAESRFADVFATCTRAPASLEDDLAKIPGVMTVETRVVDAAMLSMPKFAEPVRAKLIGIPEDRPERLNVVQIRAGRRPERDAPDEVVVSEPFAKAHDLRPGSTIEGVVHGRTKTFRVVGLGLSPEYVFAVAPGGITDEARYGIVWIGRDALAAAADLEGAFDDVVMRLSPGASQGAVLAAVDRILAPHGGSPAIGRTDQPSHHFLTREIEELETYATILPSIFVAVAAYLLNVVLSRLIGTQREQIAVLKAFGYGNLRIGLHYLLFVAGIVLLGAVLGAAIGAWFGVGLTARYAMFFRFPDLRFELAPSILALATGATFLAASVGAFGAVNAAVRLAPAEAMRPPAPSRFGRSFVEGLLGLFRLGAILSNVGRMIVRSIARQRLRSLFAALGIAASTAIIADGLFLFDSFERLMAHQFGLVMREDATVVFREPADASALGSLRALPGVLHAEGLRNVPVRLRNGHREKRVALFGLSEDATLRRVVPTDGPAAVLPSEGILLTTWLAKALDANVGDEITLDVLEGAHVGARVKIAGTVEEIVGSSAYARLDVLSAILGEEPAFSTVLLRIDPRARDELGAALGRSPRVVGVTFRDALLDSYAKMTGAWMILMSTILSVFAGVIAFGVVYNTARIALAERARELASLRVLGFTLAEITTIFVGELAVLVAVGIPLGFLLARGLAALLVSSSSADAYHFPVILEARTLAFAATVVAISAVASALVVRRKLDRLDLVGVLKTRD